jgi:hypothetical protein
MIFDNEYDYIIPLGFNCNSANACRIAGIRKEKLPFDWMQITELSESGRFLSYHKMLQDMYNNCLKFDIKKNSTNNFSILNYKAWIPHEQGDSDCSDIIEKYIKYFNRLKNILESNSKILIIISETYVKDYNKDIVKIHKNFLTNYYPNNKYYFLTINIDKNFINTKQQLNILLDGKDNFEDSESFVPYLNKFVHICKKIKLSNLQNLKQSLIND